MTRDSADSLSGPLRVHTLAAETLSKVLSKSPYALNICCVNARSLSKHIDEVKFILSLSDIHIFGICETKLRTRVPSKHVLVDGYKFHRHDRSRVAPGAGGGVAIYVRSDIKSKVLFCSSASDGLFEYMIIEVTVSNKKLAVGVIYNTPPGARMDIFEELFCRISESYELFLFMGDFNINLLGTSSKSRQFSALLSSQALFAPTLNPTRFDALLDFFVLPSALEHKVNRVGQVEVPGIADHDLVYLTLGFRTPKPTNVYKEFRCINSADINELFVGAESLPWQDLYGIPNADDKAEFLDNLLHQLFDEHVPLKRILVVNPVTPWFTERILRAMQSRDRAYRKYIRTRSPEDLRYFRSRRNYATRITRDAKKTYFLSRLNPDLPSGRLWNNLRDLGLSDNSKAPTGDFSAAVLNDHFSSASSQLSGFWPSDFHDEPNQFSFVPLSPEEVSLAIGKIKSSAVGVDDISIRFIRLLEPFLLGPLTHLFNHLITSSSFPALWKCAVVVPVPKVPSPSSVKDFRPISLLPAISKVFEYALKSQIEAYLQSARLLHPLQSGFREGHSTTTALLAITDDIARSLDRSEFTILTLLDFSRAFDSLNHSCLGHKLNRLFRFSPPSVRLILSYLSNRSQFVRVGNTSSSVASLSSGIAQGSVLGPLLFSMFINDIADVIEHCSFHLYADDLQIYIPGKYTSYHEAFEAMNMDLSNISGWALGNCLSLNASKTQCLFIRSVVQNPPDPMPSLYLNGVNLIFQEKAKNLGLIMNSRLTWSDHIIYLCSRVNAALYFLRLYSAFTPKHIRLLLVKALLVPIFTYCEVIFCRMDSESSRRLRVCFNSCLRYIHGLRFYDHISHLECSLLGMSLANYYKFRVALFLCKLIASKIPDYLFQRISFASSSRSLQLLVPRHRTALYGRMFFAHAIRTWNQLPIGIRRESFVIGRFFNSCWSHFLL